MPTMAAQAPSGPTVLVFSSQALSIREPEMNQLKASLNCTNLGWASETIAKLPSWWDILTESFPHLSAIPGKQLLQSLAEWSCTGSTSAYSLPLPNIILTPLVVVSQLVRYYSYSIAAGGQHNLSSTLGEYRSHHTEAVGFCTGLLSAYVVATSTDDESFQRLASRAITIAMFIGAFVDSQDHEVGPSSSFSVAWSSLDGKESLSSIIQDLSNAYIPVSYDENRVTVTCSSDDSNELIKRAQLAGLIVTEIGLRGRFHSREIHGHIDNLLSFCALHAEHRLPDASALAFPVWSNSNHLPPRHSNLEDIAITAILGDHCNWYATFSAAVSSKIHDPTLSLLSFGPEKSVPPTFRAMIGARYHEVHDMDFSGVRQSVRASAHLKQSETFLEDAIAVVGMSVKVAGADDLEEFWDLLCQGRSQHVEVPAERIDFETPWRNPDPKRKWFGNFIRDHDTFDHKFFRKSPREMAAADPQQRLVLQAAYQAVQQSGYYRRNQEKHIGCYLGVGTVDYERNIGCHAPNAFSATGTLKGFVAGKISHYFGWTGPSLTIDTACSASAVAVHTACKAILQGECSAALAGGATVFTSPEWFQNLAGASFLSTTGACKPFDAGADGYCRGEGIGVVFLKSLKQAIRDGDQVFGTIASSAVYQNENSTPITVPNSDSLAGLFRNVTKQAGLQPEQVTYVEAHGTGTPVGDPVEYESVRRVFGGSHRQGTLSLGSVKGLVGHTECASGIISLVKALLMINEGSITPQASFKTLNPSIKTTSEDKIEITTKVKPWDTVFRAMLINNYGASGSNASMIVTETLAGAQNRKGISHIYNEKLKSPIWLSGSDEQSLKLYSQKLRQFTNARTSPQRTELSSISFNLARQSNRNLSRSLVFTVDSIDELNSKLSSFEEGSEKVASFLAPDERPVILCFGGQVSKFVGLDRNLLDHVKLLQYYLDQCNAIFQSHGLSSLYPDIFRRSPIDDTVKLQAMLFANQYACAMCWIHCGIRPAALVGHSFGELTALCVSGRLSLRDTIEMVLARAKLVRDSWGPETGSMIAMEGEISIIRQIIDDLRSSSNNENTAEIACYNGPTSFTIAGSTASIDKLEALRDGSPSYSSKIRTKRLDVSNAFHSALVDTIFVDLEECGTKCGFQNANIHWERATEHEDLDVQMTARFVAEHMRQPVFFNHAVQRLAKRYPTSIWLEAGSRSTVTNMAKRALGRSGEASFFQAIDITSDNSYDLLAESTASLWKQGLKVTFWPHDDIQMAEYGTLILPPYQFAKSRHWTDIQKAPKLTLQESKPVASDQSSVGLFTFIKYSDSQNHQAMFRVNTENPVFQKYVAGHTIAQAAPLCPSTLQLDIAIEALVSIRPHYAKLEYLPQLQGLENHAPMCIDASRTIRLEMECSDRQQDDWEWRMISQLGKGSNSTTLHVSGKILFRPADDAQWRNDFLKYQRLVSHDRCRSLLSRTDISNVIHGRHIYKVFSDIVDYGEVYRGLQRIVGSEKESAGRVRKAYTGKTWLDTPLWDSFCQVAGIYVNCMTDNDSSKTMYISTGIEQWIRSPKLRLGTVRSEISDVLACHHRISDKQSVSDIFVFDPTTGDLLEVILGVSYTRVSKASMSKMLLKLTGSSTDLRKDPVVSSLPRRLPDPVMAAPLTKYVESQKPQATREAVKTDVYDKLQGLVAKISGLEPHELSPNASFVEVGIDSLMGMELSREIEDAFTCKLDASQLNMIVDMESLSDAVKAALRIGNGTEIDDPRSESIESSLHSESDGESSDDCSQSTSATSVADLDVCEYFAEQLGLEVHEVPMTAQLQHLGVDSLLGGELWSDLTTRFSIDLPADATFLELTVQDIDLKINIKSQPVLKPMEAPKCASVSQQQLPIANPEVQATSHDLSLPATKVLRAFHESKALTDSFVQQNQFGGYVNGVLPDQTALCIAHTLEEFGQLGCGLGNVAEGEVLRRVAHLPTHQKFVDYLYEMLDKAGKLITWDGKQAIRTGVSLPCDSSTVILERLMKSSPENSTDHLLTFHCGSKLAECLRGDSDGIQLIFGSPEGRRLVSSLYGESPINQVWLKQMQDFIKRLASSLPMDQGPLKIMEMGAGTGGATADLAKLCETLAIPVEYTFSDISGSLVAAARKRFKHYPFMRFRIHDIEKDPPAELLNTQHIVISNNCVHATHNLTNSTRNIRSVLRPDGFLMMIEMTSKLYWVDLIFGLLEGWWLFDDGRSHAVTHQSIWKEKLSAAGYGYVDWTDGLLPESSVQRILFALASPPEEIAPQLQKAKPQAATDNHNRQAIVDEYVQKYSSDFTKPIRSLKDSVFGVSVLITGATGSLGCHLVEYFANLPQVQSVICLNRPSPKDAQLRQKEAFKARGIELNPLALAKLRILQTDITQPTLGLSQASMDDLAHKVTCIVHNAWPMSIKRLIKGFESQMQAMRNLIDLASRAAATRPSTVKIGFQFISSIATVGHYPLHSGQVVVPEDRVRVNSVLPSGYGDAKLVCEHMLDQTLHKHRDAFHSMTVRIGQISGSTRSGYWNPVEHFPFLLKSSQTIKALPNFKGHLSWCPVDQVAATLGDLLFVNQPAYTIYHIENPAHQPWEQMIPWLAEAMHIPQTNLIPFDEWIHQVRELGDITDNPASKVVDFLEEHFARMSCGGLVLATEHTTAHSPTLASVRCVEKDTVYRYIAAWKESGFLN